MGDASPWRDVVDEYASETGRFQERDYSEFVSFLPYVQRFLYGEGHSPQGAAASADPRHNPQDKAVSVVAARRRLASDSIAATSAGCCPARW